MWDFSPKDAFKAFISAKLEERTSSISTFPPARSVKITAKTGLVFSHLWKSLLVDGFDDRVVKVNGVDGGVDGVVEADDIADDI